MAQLALEKRVAVLEQQVAQLSANGAAAKPGEKDWRRTIGMFTGDEGMLQLFEEALKIREADRQRRTADRRRNGGQGHDPSGYRSSHRTRESLNVSQPFRLSPDTWIAR